MEIKTVGVYKTVSMSLEEASRMCRFGQGKHCCIFLVAAAKGFECAQKDSIGSVLQSMLNEGNTNAKGVGNWEGCFWYDNDRW